MFEDGTATERELIWFKNPDKFFEEVFAESEKRDQEREVLL